MCFRLLTILIVLGSAGCAHVSDAQNAGRGPLQAGVPVHGWNILSNSEPDAMAVIAAANNYRINHLQLSHEIVHDLNEVKDDRKRDLVNRLTDAAHRAGIREVIVWDHSLYGLDYYPARFRTGPDSTIDLDNPEFWKWFKQDYRDMLDRVPGVDGLVLTFIETGARAERQHSTRLKTPQEKLAVVVNAVADVVIGERKLNLYARTFAYTHPEYENIIGAVKLFERPEIRLMMKETPHDFFLSHPNDFYAGTIDRPTLMEFDVAGEFNGQGIIANTWPEYILRRWNVFLGRKHIIGYVARTDRYDDTRIVGRPSEINLYALMRRMEDPSFTSEQAYDEFITRRYGKAALPYLKPAFKNAYDIVSSVLYTLGTNVANHSALDYDPYASSYARHVSGKWYDPPVVRLGHGIDRELHYWNDVVDHIAPPWAKAPNGTQWNEVPWVRENGWITPGERMDEEYLRLILTEKDYGVRLAGESLSFVEKARPHLKPADYQDLYDTFNRTLITARLHRAVAAAYFGFRIYARGEAFRTPFVVDETRKGLVGIPALAETIQKYPGHTPSGQWKWSDDAETALKYHEWITRTGWPAETRGFKNPYGGMTFPVGNENN